jgi:hypothetical protein
MWERTLGFMAFRLLLVRAVTGVVGINTFVALDHVNRQVLGGRFIFALTVIYDNAS